MTNAGDLSVAKARRRLRVLCADDDASIGHILTLALERQGHHVEHVDDGDLALQRIATGTAPFDVLVTDHDMPRLTGLKLVERLRALGFSGKIVVHSSHLRPKDAAAFTALGVNGILNKPTPLPELLAVVEGLSGFPA